MAGPWEDYAPTVTGTDTGKPWEKHAPVTATSGKSSDQTPDQAEKTKRNAPSVPSEPEQSGTMTGKGSLLGAAQTGFNAITAPIVMGAHILGGKKGEDWAANQFQGPSTPTSRAYEGDIANASEASGLNKLGAIAPMMHGMPAPRVGPSDRYTPPVRGGAVGQTGAPVGTVAGDARGLTADITGSTAAQAAGQAQRGAALSAATEQEAVARSHAAIANDMQSVRIHLDKHLAEMPDVPDLAKQGTDLHSLTDTAISRWIEARKAEAGPSYLKAESDAAASEAAGKFVQTKSIVSDLSKLHKELDGIPGIQNEVAGLISSLEGKSVQAPRAAPKSPEAPTIGGQVNKAREARGSTVGKETTLGKAPVAVPKTFAQLQLTSRFLHDFIDSDKMLGASAIAQRAAVKAVTALDKEMEAHTPSFRAAKDEYAKNSLPLQTLNTRFGKALTMKEGGNEGDYMSRTAPQDLPAKMFSKKAGVDALTDLLAGGPNATPKARAEAMASVDKMVENYILEQKRGASSAELTKHLEAPDVRPTLSATPGAEARLQSRARNMGEIERRSEALGKSATEATKKSEVAGQAASRFRKDIADADTLAKQPDAKSQAQALDGYWNAIHREKSSGLIDKNKLDAITQLVSRKNTIAERLALMKKLATGIAIGGGITAAGHAVTGLL